MMGEMDPKLLPDLLVFLEVVHSGSISKAARRLHTVQTNVSARMQKLEAALGRRLLTRTSRGIHLTAAGEALLPTARRLGLLLGELGQTFPGSSSDKARPLRIGSLETFAATHIAKLIASYKKVDSKAEFTINLGSSQFLMRMLLENELDLAFLSYPATAESLRTELVIKEELVLFGPENGASKVHVNNLVTTCDLPLIVQRQACSYTERFLSYLEASDLPAPRTIEAGSVEALLGLVEQGLGIAIAPRTLANRSRIKIIPLTPLRAKRWVNVYLVSNRAGWNITLKGLVEHCRERFLGKQRAGPGSQSGN
jgi:LysR family transcriptional regulator, cell division regulator